MNIVHVPCSIMMTMDYFSLQWMVAGARGLIYLVQSAGQGVELELLDVSGAVPIQFPKMEGNRAKAKIL